MEQSQTCRIKPEGNFDAFHLLMAKEPDDFYEILDPIGKLPLDAFDTINEALSEDDDSGRVYSDERDQWYAWEVIPPEGTEPDDND